MDYPSKVDVLKAIREHSQMSLYGIQRYLIIFQKVISEFMAEYGCPSESHEMAKYGCLSENLEPVESHKCHGYCNICWLEWLIFVAGDDDE